MGIPASKGSVDRKVVITLKDAGNQEELEGAVSKSLADGIRSLGVDNGDQDKKALALESLLWAKVKAVAVGLNGGHNKSLSHLYYTGDLIMNYIIDKLPDNRFYPCSIKQVKKLFKTLPLKSSELKIIHCVHFSKQIKSLKGIARSFSGNGKIEIYSIPKHCSLYLGKRKKRDKVTNEWVDNGAVFIVNKKGWWLWWPDRKLLSRYFLTHIIPHEIGHILYDHKYKSVRLQEQVAEKFALKVQRLLRNRTIK